MELSFDDLIEHVKQGREIEFYFQGQKYSVSNNREGYYLTEYNSPNDQAFKHPEDLTKNGRIKGYTIEDVWDEVVIDAIL